MGLSTLIKPNLKTPLQTTSCRTLIQTLWAGYWVSLYPNSLFPVIKSGSSAYRCDINRANSCHVSCLKVGTQCSPTSSLLLLSFHKTHLYTKIFAAFFSEPNIEGTWYSMLIEIINSIFKIMAVSGYPRCLPVVSSELNQTKITEQPTKYFTIILAKCRPSHND